MGSLRSVNKSKRLSRRSSRQISVDMHPIAPGKLTDGSLAGSTPASPKDGIMISSNNSSSTSLASHVIAPNKSSLTLASRPPSVYYSRDFLSSLAPREGGYAIAAQMGNGLGAVGTMSVEERRRSSVMSEDRPRSLARAPVSRSAGMGRWSLDGGEVCFLAELWPHNLKLTSALWAAVWNPFERHHLDQLWPSDVSI